MHNQTLDLPAFNESLSAVIGLSSLTGWLLENKKCSHISLFPSMSAYLLLFGRATGSPLRLPAFNESLSSITG